MTSVHPDYMTAPGIVAVSGLSLAAAYSYLYLRQAFCRNQSFPNFPFAKS